MEQIKRWIIALGFAFVFYIGTYLLSISTVCCSDLNCFCHNYYPLFGIILMLTSVITLMSYSVEWEKS